jgi:hypothetical protein
MWGSTAGNVKHTTSVWEEPRMQCTNSTCSVTGCNKIATTNTS